MKDTKLTERQRQFAADNHYVVEDFLRNRGLSMDKFYGVVIFGFLDAVQKYDEQNGSQQSDFSDIANDAMSLELKNHFKQQKEEKVQILSLDYQYRGGNLTFGDKVADERVDVCKTVCGKLSRRVKRNWLLHRTPYKIASIYAVAKEAA